MSHGLTTWNGFAVHGDAKVLDSIVESAGVINLDNSNVVSILSAEGENWIAIAGGTQIDEAFDDAVRNLPFPIDQVNSLLIDFCCGSKQPNMADLSRIASTLSAARPDIEIVWGISREDSSGNTFKVILLASANTDVTTNL